MSGRAQLGRREEGGGGGTGHGGRRWGGGVSCEAHRAVLSLLWPLAPLPAPLSAGVACRSSPGVSAGQQGRLRVAAGLFVLEGRVCVCVCLYHKPGEARSMYLDSQCAWAAVQCALMRPTVRPSVCAVRPSLLGAVDYCTVLYTLV